MVLALVFGFWLSGVAYAGLLSRVTGRGLDNFQVAVAVAVLWPLVYFIFSKSHFIPRSPSAGRLTALIVFMIFGLVSASVSPEPLSSFEYFCITFSAFLLALQFNTNLTDRQFEQGLKLYSFLTTSLLVLYALHSYKSGVRLGDELRSMGSNAIAVMCVSAIVAAIAFRTKMVRYLIMAAGITVLYLTGSRASAIFMLVSVSVISITGVKTLSTRGKLALACSLLVVCLVAAMHYESIDQHVETFFAVHDKWRGVGTGATGRQFAWKATWQLFLDSPITGVGFRAHERLLKIATSSHNGYLALLAETGFFGFSSAVFLIFSGIAVLWKNAGQGAFIPRHGILFGMCTGYLLLGVFERYLFNIGNATSLLFMVGIMAYRSEAEESEGLRPPV
jgi:O-antigen ligase